MTCFLILGGMLSVCFALMKCTTESFQYIKHYLDVYEGLKGVYRIAVASYMHSNHLLTSSLDLMWVLASGFYLPKSGIEIGCNFPSSFGLRFSPISDSRFPLYFRFFLF